MSFILKNQEVELYRYPEVEAISETTTEITLGDLHANPIVLLNRLIAYGIIELREESYEELLDFYYAIPEMDQDRNNLIRYHELIDEIIFLKPKIRIRLIGDETGDRGLNDYLMLKLFEKFDHAGVNLEILYSNHGFEFLAAVETFKDGRLAQWSEENLLFLSQPTIARSLVNMVRLVRKGIVSQEEINRLVKRHYLPNLVLIGYSFEKGTENLTIYSHAPIGLNTIYKLADKFGVHCHHDSNRHLKSCFDAINLSFGISVAFDQDFMKYVRGVPFDTDPLIQCLWNRDYSQLERPVEHGGFQIRYVHGHDNDDPQATLEGPIFNLDGPLGKSVSETSEVINAKEKTLLSMNESLRLELLCKQRLFDAPVHRAPTSPESDEPDAKHPIESKRL